MGGFLGIGGSSAKTDRNQQLASYQQLNSLFNYALPLGQNTAATGQATQRTGTDALSNSLNYFQKLASGNRQAQLQAVAPQSNAVLSSGDAARRQQLASGTARGGGTAAGNQQQQTAQMSTIDNMLFGAQSGAAGQEANIGGAIANEGNSQVSQALSALGLAGNTAQGLENSSMASRGQSFNINNSIANSIRDFAGGVISGYGGGGGIAGAIKGGLGS